MHLRTAIIKAQNETNFQARRLKQKPISPMELNHEVVTDPPRPAATVIMLRDSDSDGNGSANGLEVFLIKRHLKSNVLGGAFVFPGGKVDKLDAQLDTATHLDQPLPDLHSALDESDIDHLTAAGLYIAAVREVFEESGILFAEGATHAHAEQATALLQPQARHHPAAFIPA